MITRINPNPTTTIVDESSDRYQKWSTILQSTSDPRKEQVLEACITNYLNEARLIVEEVISDMENIYHYDMRETVLWDDVWKEIVSELISQIDEEEQRD